MIFHFWDCWRTNHLKAEDQIPRGGHSAHGSSLEGRQDDLSKLMQEDLRASHLSCPHNPSSNKIHNITPCGSTVEAFKDYTNGTCNYSQEQMGWDLGIVMIAQRGISFQGTFSEFPAFGGVAAISAFLCGGRLLSGISSPKGSGRAHGWSWQMRTSSLEITAPFSLLPTYICCLDLFRPQIRTPLQMLDFKAHHSSEELPLRRMIASMHQFMLPYHCTSFALSKGKVVSCQVVSGGIYGDFWQLLSPRFLSPPIGI